MQKENFEYRYEIYTVIHHINKGGNKEKLIQRIIRHHNQQENPTTFQDKLRHFLTPTAKVHKNTKPVLTQHYANIFKLVDNFNQMLELLEWPYKTYSPHFVWLVNCIFMITINSWILWNDYNAVENIHATPEGLKQFAKDLLTELFQ